MHTRKKVITIAAICVLLVGCIGVAVYTNRHQPSSTGVTSQAAKNVPKIDYSPASPNDNATINQQKADGTLTNPQTNSGSGNIVVQIVRAQQDYQDKIVRVRANVTGTTTGTCTLTLTKDGQQITKTANVIQKVNYFACDGFDIAPNEFSVAGAWSARVVVNVSDKQATSSSLQVEVSK